MSRRDTIIVAALINAGLLIILFVSALKNQEEGVGVVAGKKEFSDPPPSEISTRVEPSKKMVALGDEVDQVLKQYAQQDPLQSSPIVAPAPAVATPVVNFVEELQGMTQPVAAVAPAVPALNEVPVLPAFIEVKVKKGDVLEKIARHHHTTVQEIMKQNHLSSTQLKIGQVLKVASKGTNLTGESQSKPPETILAEGAPAKFYVVKSGDNPWTIAVKNHMKVEELLKLNQISEEKARKLKPGDKIRIR
ncbi:MAG: LysM peptidoglycan-binding domain-containing protein [Chlamydiae bacterium]|nr:LysM peptidoglycan-binding domain-containing protein [Chlamydiota bacterium]